jgi:O-antigen ligase
MSNNDDILKFFFILFCISIPIESISTLYLQLPLSLARFISILFIGLYLSLFFTPSKFRFQYKFLVPLFYVISCLFEIGLYDNTSSINSLFGIINNLILFLILYDYLSKVPVNTCRAGLLAMGICTVLVGFSIILTQGVGILSLGRFSLIGLDENNLGSIIGLGCLIVIIFCVTSKANIIIKTSLLLMVLASLVVLVSTGSRGAMLAFLISIIMYFLPIHNFRLIKLSHIMILLFLCGVSGYLILNSGSTLERWESTFTRSELAFSNRDIIFAHTIDMIFERPLLGWGYDLSFTELANRFGDYEQLSTHNTFLTLLLTKGFLVGGGFIVFLLYPCLFITKYGDNSYFKELVVIYIFLLLIFMNIEWLNRKQYWVVAAMLYSTIFQMKSSDLLRLTRG